MCFFNRLRFRCGHTQTCIFQTCPVARHTRGRTYHTTCRPSKRSHGNIRKWDLLGPCENCLSLQHGRRYYPGMYGTGIGVSNDHRYGYGYDYGNGYGPSGEGYYLYYPAGDKFYNTGYNSRYWDRGGGYGYNNPYYYGNYSGRRGSTNQILPFNPDECDAEGCMNINTPKDIQRNFQRSGYGFGQRYMGSRGLGMGGNRFLDTGYGYDDGRYMYQDDIDGLGMRGISPELETGPLRMLEGPAVDGYDGYDGMGRMSPLMGRRGHLVD